MLLDSVILAVVDDQGDFVILEVARQVNYGLDLASDEKFKHRQFPSPKQGPQYDIRGTICIVVVILLLQ